jgi:hypothetical protein
VLLISLPAVAAVTLLLIGTAIEISDESLLNSMYSMYSIIHMPSSGQCPNGFERRPKFFTERDGSTGDACASQTEEDRGTIDVIKPGESFSLWIPLPVVPKSYGAAEPNRL